MSRLPLHMLAIRNVFAFASLIGCCTPLGAADELLQRVPPGANALMAIDVVSLVAAPLAQSQGWQKKHEAAFVERPFVLPPEASRIVVAAQLDFSSELNVAWELAVMNLTEPLTMRSIARSESGYVDSIAGLDCAWTPSNAYFVALNARQLGVVFPADRQFVSRWTRGALTGVPTGYLSAAEGLVDKTHQVVLAIDLSDVPQPHRLKERLTESTALKPLSSKLESIQQLIAGVQGLTLRISVGQTARGTLQVDFKDSPQVLGSQAKPLVLETLDGFGANVPGVNDWTIRVTDKSLMLEGPLSTDALRRVFSLLELPSTKFSSLKDDVSVTSAESSTSASTLKASASKTYFKGVSVLIDDLRRTLGETRDNHAVWMERYARKVDGLPILNVDDDLLGWGANVGETFRAMAIAERASGIRSGARKSSVYGNYQYSNYGYVDYTSTAAKAQQTNNMKIQIETQEKAQAKAVRYNNWKAIEDATAAIRKEMTKRYQVEF